MPRPSRWVPLVLLAAGSVCAGVALRAQSPGVHVVKVAGDQHYLALKSDGTVVGWGAWQRGQLGPVTAFTGHTLWSDRPVALALPGPAVDVAAGSTTSYALLDDGTVWAWGYGSGGELGTGARPTLPVLANSTPSTEYRGAERPVKVAIDQVAAIAAAGSRAVALRNDGTVSEWPRRTAGGEPSARPVAVPGLANITQVSLGWSHALALGADGRVWAWGDNSHHALGVEPKDGFRDTPVEVTGVTGVAAVAAAGHVSLALRRDGTVWVWGSNGQGQFGNGARSGHPSVGTTPVPQQVPRIAGAVAISAGQTGRHVLVILKDGTVRGWGNTDFGQLGAGMTAGFQLAPVVVKLAGVKAVFAVGNCSFAVRTDGSFWGWGMGDKGRWPFQAWTKAPTPVSLP